MSEQNQQFNVVTPDGESGEEKGTDKKGVTAKQEKKEASSKKYFEERESSCVYLGVEVPKGNGGELVPNKEIFEKFKNSYTESDYTMMRDIAISLVANKPLLIESGTGMHKSSNVMKMCADLNMNFCDVSMVHDADTNIADSIGLRDIEIIDGREEIRWFDGDFFKAIRYGGVAFVDEKNRGNSKIAAYINPIIDAILLGKREVKNVLNKSEMVPVHPDFRLIAAQNPAGVEDGQEFLGRSVQGAEEFDRWTFCKLPMQISKKERHEIRMRRMGKKVDVNISNEEFRYLGEGVVHEKMFDVEGMEYWSEKLGEIIELLQEKVKEKTLARGKAQKIYFGPRLEDSMIDYVALFYRGDINEAWKNAFEYCVVNMFNSDEDKEKVRALVNQSEFIPAKKETKRKGLGRDNKKDKDKSADDKDGAEVVKTPEEIEKEKTITEIEKIKKRIEESGKAPEEWFEEQIITATTLEGEPIEFNLQQTLKENKEFYNNLNLTKWSEELPESINLTEEQIQNIKEKVEKHGFNKLRILPSSETQNKTLQKLAEETHKPIDGLSDDEQYSNDGTWLSDTVESEFPDKIITKNRPKGCYIQLYKEQKEVPTDTLDKSADDARQYQKENNLQGYTLAEYLIFQREFTAKNKKHPDNDNWTWLTDSELSSSRVLCSGWSSGARRVDVGSRGSGIRRGSLGFRSSAVLEL